MPLEIFPAAATASDAETFLSSAGVVLLLLQSQEDMQASTHSVSVSLHVYELLTAVLT